MIKHFAEHYSKDSMVTLTKEDMATLNDKNWLNDKVMFNQEPIELVILVPGLSKI